MMIELNHPQQGDVDGALCPSRCSTLDDASKALIEIIERLEPFEKDMRQRILNAAKVFLVDAYNDEGRMVRP